MQQIIKANSPLRLSSTSARAVSWLTLSLKGIGLFLAALAALIASYAVFWALWYRLPATPPIIVDRRSDKSAPSYCISFCSSLADNPHGFPGHGYVVWAQTPESDILNADSASFVPKHFKDQVPSLFTNVEGILISKAAANNMHNLNKLCVLVNADRYQASRAVARNWGDGAFRVGHRDCVAFTNRIAQEVGLRLPSPSYKFPQDYVRELKSLNAQ